MTIAVDLGHNKPSVYGLGKAIFNKVQFSFEKSGNFKIFQKSCKLITGFWKFYFPEVAINIRKGMFLNLNCKQFMFRNIPFLIFMV